MSTKFIKRLKGHSGCQIDLMQDDEKIFVRKTSGLNKYNFRLKKQCKKQSIFIQNCNVSSAKVYSAGYSNELFYFDMEFVAAKTFAEYMSVVPVGEISNYIERLFDCLYFDKYKINKNSNKIFLNKISSLKKDLNSAYIFKDVFEILENFDWQLVYKSPCHGDLTLENILITPDKKIYLIDFLDSFYNSWMIDIAKILQDIELKWSFRNKTQNLNREMRLQIAHDALIEKILKTKNGAQNLKTIYHILLLNILRIYPYTKDENTFDFLNAAVKKLTAKISNNYIGALA